MKAFDEKYVFLIGPARSGTKILRDVLSRNGSIDKVDYDINFIWKHYNDKVQDDVLLPSMVTPRKKKFIQKYLLKQRTKPENFVIEKTVSNTIRVPYLIEMFPNAKFIFLLRDGVDVIESVFRQWYETPPRRYLLQKARSIPFSVLLSYGPKFIRNIAKKSSSTYYWGVQVPGLEAYKSTEEKIAYQWMYCVKCMNEHKSMIPSKNLHTVKYEELTENPRDVIDSVLKFISPELSSNDMDLSDISNRSVGKGAKNLSKDQHKLIEKHLQEGYTYYNDLL